MRKRGVRSKRSFFAGEYAPLWMGQTDEVRPGRTRNLNLYAEAIATMPENPGIPPLFRDIFKMPICLIATRKPYALSSKPLTNSPTITPSA